MAYIRKSPKVSPPTNFVNKIYSKMDRSQSVLSLYSDRPNQGIT